MITINLHASENVITVVKSRTVRWVGHIARTRKMKNVYKISVRSPEVKR